MPAIGIDLGTTHSCVAVWKQGKVEIITNYQGNRTTPNYVAFTDTEHLIGGAAKSQRAMNLENTVFDAKRLIGRKFDDPKVQSDMKHWPFKIVNKGGKPKIQVTFKGERKIFSPEEISSMILMNMKEIAETYLGEKVKDAVITVPAYFNESQRQATKDAGLIAGLNVLRIMNEPTAAALAYGLDKNLNGEKHALIFDLGGGTFNVSILSINEGSLFQVKATGGNTHLGGENFDSQLVDYLCEKFEKKHKKNLKSDPEALRRLRATAEHVKQSLSSSTEVILEIVALYDGISFRTKVSRARFEQLCDYRFRSLLEPVEKVLRYAGLDKTAIDDVVLVGGSTRIPKIQSLLRKFFCGKQLIRSINPDEAVAYGAAVQAAVLTGLISSRIHDVLLIDVAPLSLGIEEAGEMMTKIIERNTYIPCKKTRTCSTYADNQSRVTIRVYEGERAMAKDNYLLGKFELSGIAPAPRGVPKIDVTFDIDANGILHVTAEDTSSGRSNKVTITNHKGRLSRKEVDDMLSEAEKYREQDQQHRDKIIARNQLESYIYALKVVIKDSGFKLSQSDEDKVSQLCNEIIQWLHHNRLAEVDEYKQKLEELQKLCSQAGKVADSPDSPVEEFD